MKPANWTLATFILILIFLSNCNREQARENKQSISESSAMITLKQEDLRDKIKGGWAGQVIGCTYGGPTEFRYCGTMIQDDTPIPWDDGRMKWYYAHEPGLYDDVYMDLTFVEVLEKEGLDAPAMAHAQAFAHADYQLWHANQAARYNILNGLQPPASGYWENNPHADDIDFQIESDFAGLMSPGMPVTAAEICDRIGHIMNYGDGWYGGVYVATVYSLAFIYDDVELILTRALQTIPRQSTFYQCISDVIQWYHQYPNDWKRTWFECEKKWSSDIGCPDGVFSAFNIDAKINAAYIVIGLLYGNKDYGKTIDISTRCGQDSDCNPASAAGILGTVLGYANIPDYWKQGLSAVEKIDFKYTTVSLNAVYELSYQHALQNIERHGGERSGEQVQIKTQKPLPVKYEKAFVGHIPDKFLNIDAAHNRLNINSREFTFEFEGVGFVVTGRSVRERQQKSDKTHDPQIEVVIDGILSETAVLPTDINRRRNEICWKYNLPMQTHAVTITWHNPEPGCELILNKILIYVGPS